jgi:hypothetical protein
MVRTVRCLIFRKLSGQRGVPAIHLPDGEGLGGSLPDSIIVGRTGPIPSRVALRGLVGPDEFLCSTGICLFTGLGVSAAVGFGAGALSTLASRAFVGCETDRSFDPPAARAPAALISSSVGAPRADSFSRGLDFRGFAAGVSEGSSSEGWTACFGASGGCPGVSGFFSRATITSCACNLPMIITLQSNKGNNRLSMMPPAKRMNPFTSPCS